VPPTAADMKYKRAADMKYKRSLNMKKRLSNFEDVVEMIK